MASSRWPQLYLGEGAAAKPTAVRSAFGTLPVNLIGCHLSKPGTVVQRGKDMGDAGWDPSNLERLGASACREGGMLQNVRPSFLGSFLPGAPPSLFRESLRTVARAGPTEEVINKPAIIAIRRVGMLQDPATSGINSLTMILNGILDRMPTAADPLILLF